jgi:threonine synthase
MGLRFPQRNTVAEGIRVQLPPRDRQILRVARESGGGILAVSEGELRDAWQTLARQGLFVEPTSSAAEAGAVQLMRNGAVSAGEVTVVALTGSGLKGVRRILPKGSFLSSATR